MDFYITSKSLKQIKESGIEDNFELIILDDVIQCSKFTASFLSPKISKLIRNDFTLNRFYVQFPDKSEFYTTIEELKEIIQNTNFINKLKDFLEGQPIHIDKITTSEIKLKSGMIVDNDTSKDTETAKLLIIFGQAFQNEEMINGGLKFLGIDENIIGITSKNVFDLIILSRIRESQINSQKLFDFIASNFYSLFKKENEENRKKLSNLNSYEFENILKSSKLFIEDEDSLFELITSLGPNFYNFLDYIEIQFLSIKNIQKLIELINNDEISLHPLLWSSICRRLTLDPLKINELVNPREKCLTFSCENGIFTRLKEISKGNPFTTKQIDIECSKKDCGQIEFLFDNSKNTHFRLANRKDSFIIFDFKNRKIKFSKYYFSVPSEKNTAYTGRPKSWRIEGSNDENKWELIDLRRNDSNLSTWGRSYKYDCQFNSNKFFRYIRIKDIISHNDTQEFLLSEIEFYGTITEK